MPNSIVVVLAKLQGTSGEDSVVAYALALKRMAFAVMTLAIHPSIITVSNLSSRVPLWEMTLRDMLKPLPSHCRATCHIAMIALICRPIFSLPGHLVTLGEGSSLGMTLTHKQYSEDGRVAVVRTRMHQPHVGLELQRPVLLSPPPSSDP